MGSLEVLQSGGPSIIKQADRNIEKMNAASMALAKRFEDSRGRGLH